MDVRAAEEIGIGGRVRLFLSDAFPFLWWNGDVGVAPGQIERALSYDLEALVRQVLALAGAHGRGVWADTHELPGIQRTQRLCESRPRGH